MNRFIPRVTVATIVERDGRFLFVHEIDKVSGDKVLNQPAGHLEDGESLVQAAQRETAEETGWQVEIEHFLGAALYTAGNGETYYRNAFAGRALEYFPDAALDEGIIEALWLSRQELLASDYRLRSPLVLATLDHYLAGHRYPLTLFFEGREHPA